MLSIIDLGIRIDIRTIMDFISVELSLFGVVLRNSLRIAC